MKVVCPFTDLRPETYRALAALRPRHQVEFIPVGDDPTAYCRLLQQLWKDGRSFTLVEHDVVPHSDTIDRFDSCQHHGYCAAPYEWTTHIGVTLGCTKFGAGFLWRYPDAMEIAARIPSNYGPPGHFRQIGIWLQAAVLRDLYGEQPHCHEPAVVHLNEAQRLLPSRDGVGITRTVEGRGSSALPPGTLERIVAEVAGG